MGVSSIYTFLLLVVAPCAHCIALQEVQPCVKDVESKTQFSTFNMDGKPLKSKAMFITVKDLSENGCELNTTEIIDQLALPPHPMEAAIVIRCKQGNRIQLSSYDEITYRHILFHVQIENCTVDITNINNLINIGDTRVLIIFKTSNTTSTAGKNTRNEVSTASTRFETGDHSDDGLLNIVSFAFSNRENTEQSLDTIFDINRSYPLVAEIVLANMSLEVLPSNISDIFPNLQTLEIPLNNLSLPPHQFPWTESSVRLPRNLSRTPYMQSHYNLADHLYIPNNIFRRYFNLDGNIITDLREFSFHGSIDKISLKRNGLQMMGNETFSNVTGLQNLDLSENELRTIPEYTFYRLTSLRSLDISKNRLQQLTAGVFDNLTSLELLSLANNSLISLPEDIFSTLFKLQEIKLNNNMLKELSPYSFPLSSINLKKLYFHFNPIESLPQFVFWIRSLTLADFRSTDIKFENFTKYLEDIDHGKLYHSVVDTASSIDFKDLITKAGDLRVIDLSNCSVLSLQLEQNLPDELSTLLLVMLLNFQFKLEDNPIICDCNINNLSEYIARQVANGTISRTEYFYQDWICLQPRELAGRKMLTVEAKDTYCETNVTKCPKECSCYKRAEVDRIIVDCRNKTLIDIHPDLPEAIVELWYSENNITEIKGFAKPENIYMLDVSFNKIEVIHDEVFNKMSSLKDVRLHSNALAYLPSMLQTLKLERVTIWPNPFTCDCKTRWMKGWLQNNWRVVNDSHKVACKIENEDGMLFTEVPDDKFVCQTKPVFDELRYVVLPSIASSTVVIIVLIIAVVFYAYRLECKVLLFVYFGIHPFDNDSVEKYENIDCVVVHSGFQTDWVMEEIVSLLENENYHFVVCDMARDFVVGYSFQENLTRTVRHSKRMIFCLSGDWSTSSENFVIAWRIAQEKIKVTKSHYGIIVSHEASVSEVDDKDLRRFIKRGRFIDSKDKLFTNKIVYYMPQTVRSTVDNSPTEHFRRKSEYISRCFINSYCEETVIEQETELRTEDIEVDANANAHAFISNHDEDFQYVLKELLPRLEEQGFRYCISDRDFLPGASVEENILNAIDRCHRTIFVLSPSHVQDEWSLFTFRTAYEKSLREKSNHLLVIIKDEVEMGNLDEEISHYLKNYICLNVNDQWFEKKLFNGLPLLRNKESLHSSPLFVDKENIEEESSVFDLE